MKKTSGKEHDIIFIGHICHDEVIHLDEEKNINVGGAAVYGAVAAAKAGSKIAAVLMFAKEDERNIEFLNDENIDILPVYSKETTRVQVIHTSENMDQRRVITLKYAGKFEEQMIPKLDGKMVHLAGCNDHEFTLDFIKAMKNSGYSLSIDMQCFVRNNDSVTGEICFKDDPNKIEVVSLMDKIKLDILEAKLLTGNDDPEKASLIVQKWGCPEVVITCSEGVLVRTDTAVYYETFSNRSVIGRTGRGDTTFGAYLGRRVDHTAEESLKFAAALVSMKMEKPGPFAGTLQDVLKRMQ